MSRELAFLMLQIFYAALAGIATILSGLLPLHPRIGERINRYMVGFASGVVVTAALVEMFPEADIENNYLLAVLGFFIFYFLERAVMIHACGGNECEGRGMTWVSLIGISGDNFIDGIAIAAGYLTDPTLGTIIAVAVIAHEIPQGATSTIVMRNSGYGLNRILAVLSVGAVLYPLGAFFSFLVSSAYYQLIVAFVAGEFVFIGAGELLPEAHQRFNVKVILSVVLGAVAALVLEAALAGLA